MPVDKRAASPMEVARKALHRTSVAQLTEGSTLAEAIDLALEPPAGTDDLERLLYLIVLFRQVIAVVSQNDTAADHVVELCNRVLGAALLPRGPLASVIVSSLANPVKPHPLRATEALAAATRMAGALQSAAASSSSTHLLVPLLNDVIQDGLAARPNLVAINVMVETVPADQIPANLLDRLLVDLPVAENANVRCATIASLLARRRTTVGGSDAAKDKVMVSPLLPLLAEDDDGTAVLNVRRYLLDPLCKLQRTCFPVLLEMLSGEQYSAAWITVASFGVSTGLMGISGLPLDRLNNALVHEDPRIRILAFALVSTNKSVLELNVMELVKQSLEWNRDVTQAGARTDFGSALHTFLTHLKALEQATNRDEKRAKTPQDKLAMSEQLATAAAFHKWFTSYLVASIADCRSMPPVRSIFALRMLQLYLDVFGDRPDVVEEVYTPELITLLMACQASEFAETRSQARRVIAQGPHPLPGYETLDVPLAKKLLVSARSWINHPRNTQAEAGRAALSIIFTKIVQPLGQATALAFVADLTDLLEAHLVQSEQNLSTGIVEFPLHGPLGVLADAVRHLELKTRESQATWSKLLHRHLSLVDRVWAVTRKVISLGPVEESGTAAHEIARAYEVLGDGDDDAGDDGLDHTNLLSGCWRATREAAELLSAVITTPLTAAKAQTIWSREEVDHAGLTFLTWMHEIRHRGTFSKIAPALGLVVEAAKSSYPGLVDSWVEHEMGVVAQGNLSTLRRSAALPYSILALVSNDKKLLDSAIEQLIEMARLGVASSDTTKVHAMNTLKIVLLDAKQTKLFPIYFERTLMVALAAFGSSNWNVRNSGLILFSTVAHRSLATPNSYEVFGSRAALAGRQTLASWHSRYPSIIPHIADYLRRGKTDGPATLTEHSPLFPILIILRSLRWSADGAPTADMLFRYVEPYLGSVEWQVREVAAQALSSLVSPAGALEKAKVTVTRVSHEGIDDFNTLHGRLLFLNRLFADVVPWGDVDSTDKKLLELHMRGTLQVYVASKVAVIPKAILDCVNTYATEAGVLCGVVAPDAKRTAVTYLHSPSRYTPGMDLLHESAAETALLAAQPEDVVSLLTTAVPEDAQLGALSRLDDTALQTPETLLAVIRLCTSGVGDAVLTKGYEVLAGWPFSPSVDNAIGNLMDHLWHTIERTHCIPLREAALEALGRAVVCTVVSPERLSALAVRLDRASDENMSEPSRASALGCLEHLAPLLFGAASTSVGPRTLANLHQTLLRLLEDDDADIRPRAAAIVSAGLGVHRPVVLGRAISMWWEWLTALTRDPAHYEAWEPWLWRMTGQSVDLDAEITALAPAAPSAVGEVLFVQEPPNMFRNALEDAMGAAKVLRPHAPAVASKSAAETARSWLGRIGATLEVSPGSPIDDSWLARRKLEERVVILKTALGE